MTDILRVTIGSTLIAPDKLNGVENYKVNQRHWVWNVKSEIS